MLYRLLLLSALVTLAGIGIPSRAVFFATADTKAQNREAMPVSVADLKALEKQLKSVASTTFSLGDTRRRELSSNGQARGFGGQ